MPDWMPTLTPLLLARAARLAAILLIAFLANRLLRLLTRRMVQTASGPSRVALMREQQTRTLAGILYGAGTAVIAAVALLMALDELGFNVIPVVVAAGLATLALGLGAQHLVRDVINGFFIILEDQFVVGDVVTAGGVTGRVEHMTLRRTVLRDPQGAVVVIPNGELRQVANLSRDWSQLFVDVVLRNEAAVERALAVLEAVAADFRTDEAWTAALVDGPRVLGVESLGLAGTTLRLQARTAPGRQHDVARELRRRIKVRFEQEQIELADVSRAAPAAQGRE